MYFSKKIKFLVIALTIFICHQIYFQSFILKNNLMGHDYEYFLPMLTYGKLWYQNNFLHIPWFTPSICCGTVYYADSQTMYYSIQQIFFNLFAVNFFFKFIFFTFSFVAFFGFYKLLRTFLFDRNVALFGGFVFLFNNFFIFKFFVGHFTHINFALLPIFTYFFIQSLNKINFFNKYTFLSILILVNFIYSGAGSFLPIILYSFFLILFLYLLKFNKLNKKIIYHFFYLFFISFLICASKINAVLSVMKNFPRIYDPIFFDNIYHLIKSNFFSLVGLDGSEYFNTKLASSPLLKVFWHELNFSLGILIIIFIIFQFHKIIKILNHQKKYLIFLIPVSFPYILNLDLYFLSNFFRSLPVLESLYFNYRWFVAFVPLIIIISCYLLKTYSERLKLILIFIISGSIILQNFLNKDSYNKISQSYNASELIKFNSNLKNQKINSVLAFTSDLPKKNEPLVYTNIPLQRNNFFTQGFSNLICYQPIYGYDLESMNFKKITFQDSKFINDKLYAISGGLDNLIDNSKFNMFNPACLLFPEENNCLPWDLFKKEDKLIFEEFINNRPMNFTLSLVQKVSNFISLSALISIIIMMFINLIFYLKSKIIERKKII